MSERSGRASTETCVLKRVSRSRLLEVLRADPRSPVRGWSARHRDALRVAHRTGWLSGNHGHSFGRYRTPQPDDPDPPSPYDWMRRRMVERILGFSGDYPVWARLERPSTRPSVWLEAAREATVLVAPSFPVSGSNSPISTTGTPC